MTLSEPDFGGRIGRTLADSEPWWPEPKRPPGDAPNVVMIVLDDTGFAHFGCYGSTIETPAIDRLAAAGVRYSNFHTTALCSPSRACLLTGRNHHAVGMRAVSNFDSGFPNMRGGITPRAATIAELLHDNSYATFAAGKWHLAPMQECSAAGPYDHWPLQKGFDRFYGFLQGETDQFYPELTEDNHHISPPASPEDGYHVSEDLIDQSIGWIRDLQSVRPDRPFFLYVAFGATHAPHQAPPKFIDKYRGSFDAGWDVAREEWFARQLDMGLIPQGTTLAPRNPGVLPWDELPENGRIFAARLQEAFAGFLEHTDAQIGRLVAPLERAPGWAPNYVAIACIAANTLWYLVRTDHIEVIERSLRDKVIAPDFRYPMQDGRHALGLVCALDGRFEEATDWFAKARAVLDEQGARPLRAIVDFDEALMYHRRGEKGDAELGRPLLEAALAQFRKLGMMGWIRRAEELQKG